jgi:hypothetical protein
MPNGKLFAKLESRSGLTLATWTIGLILILVLLFVIGNISDWAFLWATVGSTLICKQIIF